MVCTPFGKRCTGSSSILPFRTLPAITRPPDAPMSTAPNTGSRWRSPQERGGDAGVDRDVQTGGVAEVGRAEHEDGVGDVLRQHLPLEEGALGVVLAQLLLGDAVDG